MDCPACGKSNREGARFCRYCASVFTLHCAVCDAELVPDSVFCDACGSAVATAPAPQHSAAARKVVTVLFADLCGSTALEERMDAESVRSILDRFYAAMRAEVERHGGRVVKFTGDGLMAAFGVPDVHEDDAERAVDAALAMRTELEELASDLVLDLSLKVGINTGEVVVGGADDDVVGDAVNVASRLEGAATAGEVLVGQDTWRLTRAISRYEPITPLILKGKSEPVQAYRLLSVDERTADSAAAPFVGREAELGKLLAAFQDAVDANAARLVTIIGSPGLGKTRLARELMSELSDQARVRETRCDPAGAQTFAPIADLLRAATNISETDSEEEVIAKLAARLPEDDPDRDRIAMRAAPILGVGLAGTTEETFWALRRLIEAAASTQPVVLVLDDLHWAEPLLLDLVEHLAEWINDAPVLLVGTGRPELRDMRPSIAEGGRAATVIALEGLDENATARLALNLLETDELPAELLEKIPASTEGNPLFVRELVRMLVDDGVLLRTQDGWRVTVDVDAIQVPPTIQSLLSARVDRLRNDERTVIELASVVGKEFYPGALYDLAPSGLRDLVDGCLESLRRKELVEPAGTYWIDEPVYRFHHVLIRDAAYRRLLKESRAELHERVADWLQRKTADVLGEHDELLGYHLEQAHDHKRQLGRTDDVLGRRAADLLGAAAKRALDRDDLPAAATLSERALERLPVDDDTARSELLLIRCEALLSMRDLAHGAAATAEFERFASTPRLRAWATCFSGHLATLTAPERLQETEARVAAAAAELAALGDQAGAAKAHTVHAYALATRGRFAEGETVLDAALSAARSANDRRRITATLGMAPHAALWGPNPVSRAGGRCLDIVRLLRITTGSPAVEATSLRCQAVLEAFRGRADAARRMLRSARHTLIELGLQREVLETDQFAGIVEIVAGDPAAAVAPLRASYEGCRAFGIEILAAQSAALLARAHLALGDVDEAEALVAVSEELGGKDLKGGIDAGSVKAELLAQRGAFDEARAVAESAVALAEETDALFDKGNAYRSLSRVLRAAGDAAGAKGAEERAFALFERKGATALIEAPTTRKVDLPSREPDSAALANACTRQCAARRNAFHSGDWETLARLFSDDVEFIDRRPMFRDTRTGRDAHVEVHKLIRSNTHIETSVLAVRGDRLCLERTLFGTQRGDEAFEILTICLNEIDHSGRLCAEMHFEVDDLNAAFAELDRRYLAGEGAVCAAPFMRFNDLMRELNERNWAAAKALFLPDATVDDRTPASRGEMSVPRFLTSFKELVELTAELYVRVVAVHAASDDVIVAEAHNRGVSVDGVEVDLAYQTLVVHRDGRIGRLELFPVDRVDLALKRFDELTAASAPAGDQLENRCAQVVSEGLEAFNRRDLERMFTMIPEGARLEDRRPGLQWVIEGRGAFINNLRAIVGQGGFADPRLVATRGDRLALFWVRVGTAGDDLVADALLLGQIDDHDRPTLGVAFNADDYDAAFADMEQRYIAGEGAAFAATLRAACRPYEAFNRRDRDAYLGSYDPAIVVRDHRPASLGNLTGNEQLVKATWTLQNLVPDYKRYTVAVHALDTDRFVTQTLFVGTSNDGGVVESAFVTVGTVRDGLIASYDFYPVDALTEALQRFEELERGAEVPTDLDNAASACVRRINESATAANREGLMAVFAEDSVLDDRRSGLSFTQIGREPIVDHFMVAITPGSRYTADTVAIRGDRLSLTRHDVRLPNDYLVEYLQVTETDEEGRALARIVFDADDLDAAFAELDARYAAGEGAAFADLVRLAAETFSAWNARDWARWETLFVPDIVFVDHRPAASGGVCGRDNLIAIARGLTDLVPDIRHDIVAIHAIAPDRMVTECVARGTNAEGGEVEIVYMDVALTRDGAGVRNERFEVDQLDQALARFDELAAETPSPRSLENECTRHRVRWDRLFAARDWDAQRGIFAEDVLSEDRRVGLRSRMVGREPFLQALEVVRNLGPALGADVVAIRGERLALFRMRWGDPNGASDGFAVDVLHLHALNDARLLAAVVVFDPDDVDAAFAELDARWLASGDATEGEALAVAVFDAYNMRDWDRFTSLVAEDLVYIDHRSLGWRTMDGAAALAESVRTAADVSPDRRIRLIQVIRCDGPGDVYVRRQSGSSSEGGELDWEDDLAVAAARNGKVARIEFFPIDRLDDAIARANAFDADEQEP